MRALPPALLETCLALCTELRLDALVEVRSADEMDTATRAGARLIGINNRDLRTFKTDIRTSMDLARKLRPGQVIVSESGIHGREQIDLLLASGICNFLIGESLVKSADPVRFLRQLTGDRPPKTGHTRGMRAASRRKECPHEPGAGIESIPWQRRSSRFPRSQVKVCGLTSPEEATACADLGAHAIGLVFYPPSPRFVTDEQAREICRSVSGRVCTVGVFVNESPGRVLDRVERCGLAAVQLHGKESPEAVEELMRAGVKVIKALFSNAAPSFASVGEYAASAYLVECAGGPLPGGNALQWDYGAAAGISRSHPVVLAGGLNSENVNETIRRVSPDAVDVSSGVESRPGRKDLDKVKQFLETVSRCGIAGETRRIFP